MPFFWQKPTFELTLLQRSRPFGQDPDPVHCHDLKKIKSCLVNKKKSGRSTRKDSKSGHDALNHHTGSIKWKALGTGCRFHSISMLFGFPRWDWRHSPKIWMWPVNFTHNHVDVSIDVIKSTIDITTIVVYWVIHIILPLCDANIIVWMLHISLYSKG